MILLRIFVTILSLLMIAPSKSEIIIIHNNHSMLYHNKTEHRRYNIIKNKISKQYSDWEGVSYLYGGVNKDGVDCSALVRNIYSSGFNHELPRTTYQQIKKGRHVRKSGLRPGI